jgi:hypothetical protein
MKNTFFVGFCGFILIELLFLKSAVAWGMIGETLIDAKYFYAVEVKELSKQPLRLYISAKSGNSAAGPNNKTETEIKDDIMSIKVYQYSLFNVKEKINSKMDIELELTIPDKINKIVFFGSNESIWTDLPPENWATC